MASRSITALLSTLATADAATTRMMSDKERMRQQAEHLCYNDVQTLCNAMIPDEGKIAACMKTPSARPSSPRRKVIDAGAT